MVGLLSHRQTKEAETDMFNLLPPRHISTLPKATELLRGSEMTRCAKTGLMLRNKEHHSRISSARPDSGNGIVMPSARAVFMLMYSSTLVTCWTGRSAGFSPLSMRPV